MRVPAIAVRVNARCFVRGCSEFESQSTQ